ncbi:TBC1 domain family member 30-like isoform X3 [Lineus longissimus]|uniref:TBC1 domain family member 30-like isoform X3 n=1 Tax=Lineus longissimus TaxID=88925 RepID=UPI00315DD248
MMKAGNQQAALGKVQEFFNETLPRRLTSTLSFSGLANLTKKYRKGSLTAVQNGPDRRRFSAPGIDTRIKFSLEPVGGDDTFQQWHDAMKAVARLPLGIPREFRKKVWLSLADNHIKSIQIDWEKTKRFCFNERSNPDDNKLGIQIVKDLHRTGCSGFSGQDNEQDRAVLKRVLLAYARWNKHVGYCQGFNVLAALILEVMERREDDTLKVMIFLIDHVLPDSYFANNLRALSVDMAVFRDLLRFRLDDLSKHLDYLQTAARDKNSGVCQKLQASYEPPPDELLYPDAADPSTSYEPPLTNVFTMQWFLTMFATCLPKPIVLRVWDSIFLEGSEILLRTALGIWEKLADRIMSVESADEFYSTMGVLTQDMLDSNMFDPDRMMKNVYSIAPFPHPQVKELREKYTYNITPFTAAMSTGGRRSARGILFSDDDDIEDEDLEAVSCFTGILGPQNFRGRSESGEAKVNHADISNVSPGAYAANPHEQMQDSPFMERMTTDIDALRKQYEKLRQRQQQAHVILAAANARHNAKSKIEAAMMPKIETPTVAMNHLFVSKGRGNKNRHVTEGPRIAIMGAPMVKAQLRLTHPQKQANRSRRPSQSDETCSMSSVTTEEPCSISEAGTYCQDRDESEVTSIVSSGDLESHVSEPDSKISVGSDGEVINGGASVVPSVGSEGSDSAGDLRSSSSDNGVIKEKLLKDKCNLQSKIQLQSLHGESCHLQEIRDGFVIPKTRTDYSASGTSDDQETDQDGDLPLEEQAKQDITAAYITTLTYKSHKSAHDKTSPLPSYTPSPVESPTKEKIRNPFPVRYASQQRHKNGVKLGLYDPETALQDYEECHRQRPSHTKGISRAHINMCLHRQYMAEVRESAKKTKR